jgi:hypothetical protein
MTFDAIVIEIRERLGIPSTATESVARIGRQVNSVYKEITTSLGIDLSRRSVNVSGATSIGSATVTFSGIEKIERLIDDTSGSIRVIPEVTFDQLRNINPAASDTVRKWAVQSWTGTTVVIRLDVLAQTVFNLKADGYATVATLSGSDVPAFPESYHDILVDGVLLDEYMRQEKLGLADRAEARFEKRLSDLRMWRAKSITQDIRQGENSKTESNTTISGSGGGGAPSGGTSYTQTGLLTFDRDPDAPFAVTSGSAMVSNLDAEYLGGSTLAQVITAATAAAGDVDGPASSTDNAIVRFDSTTGKLLQNSGITIADGASGTLSNTNSGDVTLAGTPDYITISNQVITRGLIDLATDITGDLPYANLTASGSASKLLGRGSSGAGDWQEITLGTGLSMSSTTLNASSAVKPVIVFTPQHNNPPATAYATPDTRNSHLVLDFDGATDEEAVFAGVLPASYAGGGLYCEIYVAFTSATSGSVRFQAAIERMDFSSIDIDADSFASFQSAGGTAPGTSGQIIAVTVQFTAGAQMDSLAAGEAFRLKIRRDADGTSGTDDIGTDAEVLRVVLREP